MDRAASSPSQPSVRALIHELAQVEDAVRLLPTYVTADDGAADLNPELLSLLDREREIVLALRGLRLREIDLRDPSPSQRAVDLLEATATEAAAPPGLSR